MRWQVRVRTCREVKCHVIIVTLATIENVGSNKSLLNLHRRTYRSDYHKLGTFMEPHREACRRQHRVLGHFLAVQAWLRGLECVVLVRSDLEAFLDLVRFKGKRVKWLCEDLSPWFPNQVPYYLSSSPSSLHSLFLSRVPIAKWLADGSMSTERRILKIPKEGPKTERFSKAIKGHRFLTEADMVRYLAVLNSGLTQPQAFSSAPIETP